MERPTPLYEESFELSGARKMLQRIIDTYKVSPKDGKRSREEQVYIDAELRLILSSVDNVRHFLCGDLRIHYRNWQRDKKGNLTRCEAYFAP